MLPERRKTFRESLCRSMTRGATLLYRMVWCKQSCRRRWNIANRQWWFPRNLGEPCSLLGELPDRSYRITNSRPWRRTGPPGSETNECNPRYRQAKGTKCGGMAAGRHSVLIVPTKLANSTRLEPVEESETPIHGTVLEQHDECIEIRQACPRNRNG